MAARHAHALFGLAALALIACEGPSTSPTRASTERAGPEVVVKAPPETPANKERPKMKRPLTGEITRAQVLALPRWAKAFEGAAAGPTSAKLAAVPPGAQVYVILGTWCSDSRDEVTRFWRALDAAGEVPFEVEYWGTGFGDYMPEVERAEELEVIAVPTFAVFRDGEEIGRVVERSERGIEVDLYDLLTGAREGQISATRGR